MANKFAGEISIRLDRVRTMVFDWGAAATFQSITGKTVEEVLINVSEALRVATDQDRTVRLFQVLGPNQMAAILYSCLKHDDPTLKLDEMNEIMNHAEGDGMEGQYNYLLEKVIQAWHASRGKATKKKVAEQLGGKNGTGTNSEESPTDTSASSRASSGA